MVARTPQKQRKTMVAPPLSPTLIRETVKKVDQCMARLQELQYTVNGGNKVVSGVKLSPRSTKSYLKTSLRCKQEFMRIKNNASKKSPTGKLPASVSGEWRRMSLSAMLVGETVTEILQASKITREVMKNSKFDDPKTPLPQKQRSKQEKTPLETRRKREKQHQFRIVQPDSSSPCLRRARSKINFKVTPERRPEIEREIRGKQSVKYVANRVSPKHKPWAKKTVLFPNPLFHSSPTSNNQQFCKTKSPLIAKKRETPHKFLVKSPVKIHQNGVLNSVSPVSKATTLSRKSPVKIQQNGVLNSVSPVSKAATLRRKSPVRIQQKGVFNSVSPVTTKPTTLRRKSPPKVASSMASKLRRSLSPSRLANRFVSPLKGRRVSMNGGSNCDELKQRPPPLMMMPMRFSASRTVATN